MALIEGGIVTELHNLSNEIEVVYGSTRHREYIPKTRGIRIKRKGNIVYLLLDSDVHAAEGAPVIKMDYRLITDPHCGSPSTLVNILLNWISGGVSGVKDSGEIESNVYIGKLQGENGDFDVSYVDNDTLRFNTMPQRITEFTADDIELVRQINHLGSVVATYDRNDTRMDIVNDRLTVTGANFNATDSFVVVTNVYKHILEPDIEFMDSYIGKPTGQNGDFSVHYHNFHMIHFADFNMGNITKVYSEDIATIKVMDVNDNIYLNITHEEYDIHTTANGLQIDGNDATDIHFRPTDRFIVYTNIPRKIVGQYNNPIVLVTNTIIGLWDDIWIDQGVEINCRGYNNLSLWCVFQPNGSIGNELKALSKHTAADADEYRLSTYTSYIRLLGNNNVKVKYDFSLNNSTPFVQIQTRTVGIKGTTSSTTTTTAPNYVPGRIWIKYTLGY